MTRNKRCALCLFFTLIGALSFAGPWGIVSYAEGSSFVRIRDGKSQTFLIQKEDVFGMEIRPGDVFQTMPGSFLELKARSVDASIMIAENTSFECKTDPAGPGASGSLYYGRVRAKVAKLTGKAGFGITSPALVAGVRGTDFGLDAIVAGPGTAEAPDSRVLYRVFCLDGSVLVSAVSGSPLAAAVIGKNEMVERLIDPKSVSGEALPLAKKAISADIVDFWVSHPFGGVEQSLLTISSPLGADGGKRTITQRPWPSGTVRPPAGQNVGVVRAMAAALIGVGTFSCVGASAWSETVDRDDWAVEPAYSAGCIMIGSGSVLAILSLFAD